MTKQTTYERARAEIEAVNETVERMAPAMAVADEVAELFPDLAPRTCPVIGTGSTIISVTVTDLRQMIPVGREIIARGFHPKRHEDSGQDGHRRYFYENESGLSLQVFAQIPRENAVCHFKQIGVKEQPVYELVCG